MPQRFLKDTRATPKVKGDLHQRCIGPQKFLKFINEASEVHRLFEPGALHPRELQSVEVMSALQLPLPSAGAPPETEFASRAISHVALQAFLFGD
eukprot:s6678_g3.t1